ncbi:hypothetical protein ABPG75_011781 [Micractinium tetrahymenae]
MTAAGGRRRLPLLLHWAALLVLALAARYPLQWLHSSLGSTPSPRSAMAAAAAPLMTLEQWAAAGPGAEVAYRTPHSRCTLLPDGRVQLAPGWDNSSSLPFLFDTASMPTRQAACGSCDASSHGVQCCGACMFGDRLCAAGYPGQNRSAAAAELLMRNGFPLQDLTPCELFARIRGRTLWFAGDSHTWGAFAAAECFLREFAQSLSRRPALHDPAENLALRLLSHVSAPACLELVHGTRVCGIRVDTAAALQTKRASTAPFHVHYSPFSDFKGSSEPIRQTYVRELTDLTAWRQQHALQLPRLVWMETGPQHFFTPQGLYPGPQAPKPYRCRPLQAWYQGDPETRAGSWRNAAVAPLVPRLADTHLRIYNASVPLWESHMPGECSHWCHPAAYELWVFLLNDVLRDSGLGSAVVVQRAMGPPPDAAGAGPSAAAALAAGAASPAVAASAAEAATAAR